MAISYTVSPMYGIRVIAHGREDVYPCTVESMEVIWDSTN